MDLWGLSAISHAYNGYGTDKELSTIAGLGEWAERRAMFIRRSSLIVGCVLSVLTRGKRGRTVFRDKVARLLSQKISAGRAASP